MDGFSYFNIFETKGFEYLIIITFLVLLIPFSIILNRKVNLKKHLRKITEILTAGILNIPQGVLYSENHTWAHMAKSGIAHVGLDDLLLHITGEVKLQYHKNPGDSVQKGELMTEIDHQGKLLQIFSPISGKVMETNQVLIESPGILNEDPYESGWVCKIKPSNWKAETQSYYLAESATEWSQREVVRFRDFLASSMPKYMPDNSMVAMQDGGELRDHVLSELPGGVWHDFQQEFLNPDAKQS